MAQDPLCWIQRSLRWILGFLTVLCLHLPLQSQSREYELKAAFLFNFTQFVEYPTNAFATAESPYVIAILGTNPFGLALEEITRDEKVAAHPVQVRYVRSLEQIDTAHILFISRSEDRRWPQIRRSLQGKPLLTVSDMELFAQRGGMIRFQTVENKIRFVINATVAKEAGLTLSSKLLRLAEIVETSETD